MAKHSRSGGRTSFAQKRQRTRKIGSGLFALEPRMMYDGAAVATASAATHVDVHTSDAITHPDTPTTASVGAPATSDVSHQSAAAAQPTTDASATPSAPTSHEIVIIDGSVPDLQVLLNGVKPGEQVFVLDPTKDGVQQIADIVQSNNLHDLSAIQIISHGGEGDITLGSIVLNNANLADHAAALKTIGDALTPDGDITLYGCEVAGGTLGQSFINGLASYTGADVAASTDPVGSPTYGANWTLEASTGPIEATTPFTDALLASYPDLLANLSATQTTVLTTDVDGDGVIDPGDTVTTTVTITDNSTGAATNVNFSETLQGMTQTGTEKITPIAFDDAYTLVGNTPITVDAASGLLANDIDPDASTPLSNVGLTAISAVTSASTHGSVVLNSDGSFTYTPDAGFAGTATFQYTAHDAQGLNSVTTGTVTLTVTNPVWYVDSSYNSGASGASDGSFAHPFTTVNAAINAAAANTKDANGAVNDTIFIYNRGTTYSAATGITLATGEQLLGDGSSLTSVNNNLVGASTSNASFSVASGTAVTLGSGNTISGLNISESGSGAGIADGGNVGTLHFVNVAVSTSSGAGISLLHGGTVDATGTNTINSTSGVALDVANTTIGSGNLTFKSISSGAGANDGIILDTTGTSGGLHVTGDGSTAGSGGTIQHKTGTDGSATSGIGIYLNSTTDVELAWMQLNDFDNFGIRGTGVTGFTLDHSVINSNAAGNSWNGNNSSSGIEESSISFDGLFGSASISNSSISDGYTDNIRVLNGSGTLDRITISNVTIGTTQFGAAADGSQDHGIDGILLETTGTAILNATVQNSTFTAGRYQEFQLINGGTGATDLIFTGNHLSNNYANLLTQPLTSGAGAVWVATNGQGNLTYNIGVNTFRDSTLDAVTLEHLGGIATMTGTVTGNSIGVSGVANSGSLFGNGVTAIWGGGGTFKTTITNNTIQQYNDFGISLQAGFNGVVATGTYEAIVTGNTIGPQGNNPTAGHFQGIGLNAGTTPGDGFQVYLELGGTGSDANTVHNWTSTNGLHDIRLRQRFDTTVHLTAKNGAGTIDYAGGPSDTNAVVNFIQTYNTTTNTSSIHNSATVSGTGGGFVGGAPPLLLAPGGVEAASSAGNSGSSSGAPATPDTAPADTSSSNQTSSSADTADINVNNGVLTQEELNVIVDAAIQRWAATGLTTEQIAYLEHVTFTLADLSGMTLGAASNGAVSIDINAAGHGWYIDSSPLSDAEFANNANGALYTNPNQAPAGHVDLLTTVMHELGHELGLTDTYSLGNQASLMYGYIVDGERRLPVTGQADGAVLGNIVGQDFALGSISIGTLPAGKSVSIIWTATVDQQNDKLITNPVNQGSVTSSNLGNASTNTVTTTLDTLTLGGTIFNDADASSTLNTGDTGISGVALTLFDDTNHDNVFDAGDTQVATTTTAANGTYSFTGLAPGDYLVQVDSSNFTAGHPLASFKNASPTAAGDPDGNVDSDNDGQPLSGGAVVTKAITLSYNNEPTAGTGNDTNTTIDIGLVTNQRPTVDLDATATGTGYTTTFTEGGSAVSVASSNVSVGDPDNTLLKSATITITNFQSGQDLLSFTANGSTGDITAGAFSGGALTLTSAAGADFATWQAALQAVTYRDISQNPNTTDRSITVVVDDGEASNHASVAATATVHVAASNNPPAATTPGTDYSATEQTNLNLRNTGLSVSDVDGNSGIETATLSVDEGTITISAGDSGVTNIIGSGTGNVSFQGTIAQINALLNTSTGTVSYIDNTDTPAASTRLTLTIQDNGNTGGGGNFSNSAQAIIDITAVNDAPAATAPGTHYTATEQTDLSLRNTGLSVGDIDSGGGVETVTLSVGEGKITIAVVDSGVTIDSGNGTNSVTVSGTIAQINAMLNSSGDTIVYNDNTDTPAASTTLTLTIHDNGHTGTGGDLSASASSTVDLSAVNDAPVATITQASYNATENANLDLKGTLSVSDVDGGSGFETVTVSVGEGVLNVSAGGSGAAVINTGTSTVTIVGTAAQINALLNTDGTSVVGYIDNNAQPSASTQLTLTIDDNGDTGTGGALTSTDTATINIAPANDPPTLTASATDPTYTENGAAVALFSGASISTVETGQTIDQITLEVSTVSDGAAEILNVDGSDVALTNGTSVTTTNGLTVNVADSGGTEIVTISKTGGISAAAAQTLVNGLTYRDTSDSPTGNIRFVTLTSIQDSGGGTDTTILSITSTVQLTAVNDGPVAAITPTSYSATEQTNLVLQGTGLSVSDIDGDTGSETVTLSVGEGIITVNVGDSGVGGLSGSGTNTVTFSGTLAQLNNLLGGTSTGTIVYNDNTDAPSASTPLTLTINDNGNTGGGALTASDTATINIAAVNDAPVGTADSYTTSANTTLTVGPAVGLLGNDTDADGNPLHVSQVNGLTSNVGTSAATTHGSVTVNADGSFTYTPTAGYSGSDSFTYTANDGTVDSNTVSVTLTVNAVNANAPVLTASNASQLSYTELAPTPTTIDAGLNVTDPDSADLTGATVSIGGLFTGDELRISNNLSGAINGASGTINYSYDSGTGVLTLSGTDTVADYQAALRLVTFDSTSHDPTNAGADVGRTITVSATDGTNLSNVATYSLSITAVNDAPLAHILQSSFSATEGVSVDLAAQGLQIGDPDGSPITSIETVTLSVNEGTITVIPGIYNALTVQNSGTSTVTITGALGIINGLFFNDPTAVITYVDNNNNPSATDTLTLMIHDNGNTGTGGDKSATATSTINITPVNDAPTATAASSYNTTEQTDLNLRNTGLSVSDVDGNSGVETATLSVGEGIINITAGDSNVTNITGNGTGTVSFQGTLADINALLNTSTGTVVYNDNTDAPASSTTLTLTIDDGGNTGGGAGLTASAHTTINVSAVNDAPVATVPGTAYTVIEQQALDLKNTGLSVSDPDGGNGIETVTLSVNELDGQGILNVTGGSSGASVSGSGTSSVTITGTVAQINALLNTDGSSTVSYIDSSNNPSSSATLTLAINDNGNSGTGGNLTDSKNVTINITHVNNPPSLDLDANDSSGATGANFTTTYVEGHPGVSIVDTDVSVTDPDNTTLTTATVTITNFQAGEDVLGFTVNPTTMGDITLTGNSGGVLTLTSSGGATFAQWQAALQAVTYSDSSPTPNTADRIITVTVDDGQASNHVSNTATTTVHIGTVNDPPSLAALGTNQTFTENGTAVDLFNNITISTVESGQAIANLTLTVSNVSDGLSEILNIDGSDVALVDGNLVTTSTNGVSVSVALSGGTATISLSKVGGIVPSTLQTIIDSMTYRDTGDNPTGGARDVTLTSIQDNGGTANGGADTTPLSVVSTVTVVPVNDNPVVGGAGNTITYTELQSGGAVVDAGITVSDVDSANLANATVTLASPLSGDELQINGATSGSIGAINYSYDSGTGVLSLTGVDTVADYQAALRLVTFDSTSHDPTNGGANLTRSVTWRVDDGSGANNLSGTVGSTVDVTAVNDAPVATITQTGYGTQTGVDLNLKNTGLSVSDVDANNGGETITLSVGEGVLTVTAGGSGASVSGSGTGSVTISGTIAQLNALLNSDATSTVDFVDNIAAPGSNVTLTLAINDNGNTGGGNLTSTETATITFDQAPVLNNAGNTFTYTELSTPAPIIDSAITITDGDAPASGAQINSASVTISSGAFAGDLLQADTTGTSISLTWNGTDTLSLSGPDTIAHYEQVLQSVTFSSSSHNPTNFGANPARTITWQVADNFNVASATVTSTINIDAVNDPAVISGTTSGATVEAGGASNGTPGTPTATGALTDTDVDNTPNDTFLAVAAGTASDKGYGTFSMTAGGTWIYTLDNNAAITQALNAGDTVNDTFTVHTADGTAQTITIAITGSNDNATISGTITGDVTEKGGNNNNTGGSPDPSETLTSADVDGGQANTFQIESVTGGTHHGTFTMTSGGTWTYTLNQDDSAVQALNVGDTLTDTFTVSSIDGTDSKTITITIHGANDSPAVAAGNTVSFDANNGTPLLLDPTITVTDVDNATLVGATVKIDAGLTSDDRLTFTKQNGITGVYDSTTGILTLSGVSSVANYQTALASITFESKTQTSGTRTVTWQVDDGSTLDNLSNVDTTTINVQGLNQVNGLVSNPQNLGSGGPGEPPPLGPAGTPILDLVGSGGPIDLGNGTPSFTFVHASVTTGDITGSIGPDGGHLFTAQVPLADLAAPLNGGQALDVFAQLIDGNPLPAWLHFNPATGVFDGEIPNAAAGKLTIEVVARDSSGHESILTFTIDLASGKVVWNAQPQQQRMFAERLSAPLDRHTAIDLHRAVGGKLAERLLAQRHAVQADIAPPDRDGDLPATPRGRAALSDQLKAAGWHGMHSRRMALLESVRQHAASLR